MSPADFDFSQYNSPSSDAPLTSSTPAFDTGANSSFDLGGAEDGYSATSSFEAAGPPYLWLIVGIGVAVAGIVLGLALSSVIGVAFAAWALSGPIAIGSFAVFSLRDTKERAKPLYGQRASAIWLHRVGLVLALAGVIIAALAIAQWAGRL